MGQGSFQSQQKHRPDTPKHLICNARHYHRRKKAEQPRRDEKSRQHCDANSHRICIYVDRKGNIQADSSTSIGESDRNDILGEAVPRFREFLDRLSLAKAPPSIEMDRECTERTPPVDPFWPPTNKSTIKSLSSPHLKRSRKRRRSWSEEIEMPVMKDNWAFVEDAGTAYSIKSQEDHMLVGVNDTEKLTEYLHDAFTSFQQINCRTLCKSLIRTIEPKKQVNFPYNGNIKPKGPHKSHYEDASIPKEADPEETKPKWWPDREVCPHKEPDHIKKEQRLGLLSHMLLNTSGQDIKCSVGDLKNAFATDLVKIKPAEKANILLDVWKVVEEVERFRGGLIDASAKVFVQSRKEEARMLRGGGRSRKTSDDVLGEDDEGDNSAAESQDEDDRPSAALVPQPSFHPQIRYASQVVRDDDLSMPTPDGRPVKQESGSQYRLGGFEEFRDQPDYRMLRASSPIVDKPRDHLEHGEKFNTFGSGDNIGLLPDGSSHDGLYPGHAQAELANWSMGSSMVPMQYGVSPSQPDPAIPSNLNPMLYQTMYLPARHHFTPTDGFYPYSPDYGHFPTDFGEGLGDDPRHQLHSVHQSAMHCHTPSESVPNHGQDLGPHVRPLAEA